MKKRIRKSLYLWILALALSVGLTLPKSGSVFADGDHGFILDDSCVAVSDKVVDGLTCTYAGTDYGIKIGSIANDGGFYDYSEEVLASVSYGQNRKSINIADEEIVANGYIHLNGDDSVVSAYVDGTAMRFSAGNIALSVLDGHIFGIGANQNDNQGGEGGNGDGHIGGQTVVWEYGNGENQISGGKVTLDSACEPAWAYDANAAPDEFLPCVGVEDEMDTAPYTISQNNRGGSLRVEQGIKLVFSILPDEGYKFNNMSLLVDPVEAEDAISGTGDSKGFEFVMPENADIRIVVEFVKDDGENAEEEETGGIKVIPCDSMSVCDFSLPEIKSAEAEDVPDGAKIQIRYGANDDEYNENWGKFALEIYGSEGVFEEFVENISDEDMESGKAVADALKKFGKILFENYDIRLFNSAGESIKYDGDGLKITLELSDELDYFSEALEKYYDGNYEFVMSHIKSDGSIEYLPLTKNADGTYTFNTKSLSPFGLVARVAATVPVNTNADNPVTLDTIMSYVALNVISLAGLGMAALAVRRCVAKR